MNTPEQRLTQIVANYKNGRIDLMWDREEKKWRLALGFSFTKFSGETLSEVISLALAWLGKQPVTEENPKYPLTCRPIRIYSIVE